MKEAIEETKNVRNSEISIARTVLLLKLTKEFQSPLEELFQSSMLSEELAEVEWDISHLPKLIAKTRKSMFAAAAELDFEKAQS